MKLHHIAIWTFRLEELKEFYVRFFGGKSNEKYINPKKGFESYFISFGEGTDLELMSRTDVQNTPIEENRVGLTHFAFTFPSQEEVLRFTEQMRSEGYTIAGEPRTSGDGYFESVVLDPDGNRIECVYRKTANESKNKARQETDIENIPPVTLHTERLFLRPFEERDAETFFACCQNPNLGNNAGWPPHRTLDESRRILHSTFINQEGIWAVILKDTKQLIGSVGIIPDPKRENPQVRMLGYWLDESYWGKGYMTEAVQGVLNYGFEELRLSLITATCYPHNKRSQKVLKKNGFIAVTEVSWFTPERPAEIEDFWMDAYPEINTIPAKTAQMEKAGYIPTAHFILPEKCWTEHFYAPQVSLQEAFLKEHPENNAVKDFIANQRYEQSLYHKYKEYYGYVFYIGQKR